MEPLLELLSSLVESDEQDDEDISFDSIIQDLLPDLIHVRNLARGREVQSDEFVRIHIYHSFELTNPS